MSDTMVRDCYICGVETDCICGDGKGWTCQECQSKAMDTPSPKTVVKSSMTQNTQKKSFLPEDIDKRFPDKVASLKNMIKDWFEYSPDQRKLTIYLLTGIIRDYDKKVREAKAEGVREVLGILKDMENDAGTVCQESRGVLGCDEANDIKWVREELEKRLLTTPLESEAK